jgi:hypothetical protein
LPVYQLLDWSTGHLPEPEMALLSSQNDSPWKRSELPRVIQHHYGALVHVSTAEPEDDERLRALLPNLHRCVEHARRLDRSWINFARDADTEPGLPVFEW